MHAAAQGKKWAVRKVDPEVAKEFADSDPGGKLPERTKSDRAKKRYPKQAKD
jgi:hypothetical protein